MNIRPNNLNEFITTAEIINQLKIAIQAAIKNNQNLDHCLFYGPAGTGKTSIALIIANELQRKIRIVQAVSLQKISDIINILSSIKANEIIFIDEIHSLNKSCEEILYTAMEDFVIDITIGKNFATKNIRIPIHKFTLIGATTAFGKISSPLEERFGIIIKMSLYKNEEMEQIITSKLTKMQLNLNLDEIKLIANNSRGIPRIAMRIMRRIQDYKTINNQSQIATVIKEMGFIHQGLTKIDFEYLKFLTTNQQQKSLKSISAYLNLDIKTIEEKIEPLLIANNLITKSNKGRLITDEGKNIFQLMNNIEQ